MKKSVFLLTLIAMGFLLVGFGPRPYSDLATYKRIPTVTRVDNLLKAGKDLYLRRRYEDARSVFQMVLNMDKDNLEAQFYISKIANNLELEQNERNKQALYKKWGHLTPIDKIYENWRWGPEVGHFEVRYSEPKPYVPAVRKFRPKATDEEVAKALKAYKASKTADNGFELAMCYWSRREKDNAIKYYLEATDMDPEILGRDDEYMLSMISEELEEKLSTGKPTANDYLTYGRLALIQGNRDAGITSVIKAATKDSKLSKLADQTLSSYIARGVDIIGIPAEFYSFRQAYVFDKDKDSIYMRVILCPKDKRQLIPIDTTLPASTTGNISIESKDALFIYNEPGIGNSTRLWVALPEKEGEFPEYEVRLIISLKREESHGIELSNYVLPAEQPDNWSFIITSEFNTDRSDIPKNYEKIENGLRISAYHLGTSDGKGPYIPFEDYKESLPSDANVWKILEDKEGEMSLL